MGVTGLWQILSPAGRPISLESLDGQVLAVDISIWLNQAICAMRDTSGHAISNAHLLNLYQRLCKLMYFHIRPVFVFDGTPPALKQSTLRARRQRKEAAREERHDIDKKLLTNFLQQHALNHVAQERSEVTGAPVAAPPKLPPRGFAGGSAGGRGGGGIRDAQMFCLPRVEDELLRPDGYQLAVERHWQERKQIVDYVLDSDLIKRNLLSKESVDFESEEFRSLPLDVQHEILQEIKFRRKDKHSWHKIKQMPKKPSDFMEFQLESVLFRGKVTHRLDKLENEMKRESAGDLVTSLTKRFHDDDGETSGNSIVVEASKIAASADGGHYVYIKNGGERKKSFMSRIEEENRKQEAEDLKIKMEAEEAKVEAEAEGERSELEEEDEESDEDEWREEDEALERAIALSLQNQGGQGSMGDTRKKALKAKPHFGRIMNQLENDDGESVWKVASEPAWEEASSPVVHENGRHGKLAEDEEERDLQRALALSLQSSGDASTVSDVDSVEMKVEPSSMGLPHISPVETEEKDEDGSVDASNAGRSEALSNDLKISSELVKASKIQETASNIQSVPVADSSHSSEHVVASRAVILEMLELQKAALQSSGDKLEEEEPGLASLDQRNEKDSSKVKTVYEENERDLEVSFVQRKNLVSTSSSAVDDDDDDEDEDDDDDFEEVLDIPSTLLPNLGLSMSSNPTASLERDGLADSCQREKADSKLEKADSEFQNIGAKCGKTGPELEKARSECERAGFETVEISEDVEGCGPNDVDLGQSVVDRVAGTPSPGVDEKGADLAEQVFEAESGEPSDVDAGQSAVNHVAGTSPPAAEENGVDLSEAYLAHRDAERNLFRDLGSKLDEERSLLEESRQRQDRVDVVTTDQMTTDCQELLRLFGVPYVVAASEAEAQCAFLESAGLTAGTVTDDSDVWLFGGRVVYRNFFKKDKDVERFKIEDVQSHLRLDRPKMICFAMLTGSDYTDGVEGVGGVTAFEFLHEFNVTGLDGLRRLRSWWEKASKVPEGESFKPVGSSKVKNRLRQLTLSEGFPSQTVFDAYEDPVVDESLEEFSWASSPDVAGVREFARVKFGWSREKTDESLLPVVEKMKERKGDTIDKWVKRWSNRAVAAKKAQTIPSQRIKKVLVDLNVLDEEDLAAKPKEPKVGRKKREADERAEKKGSQKEKKEEAKNNEAKTQSKPKERKRTAKSSRVRDAEFKDPDSIDFPGESSKAKPSPSTKATSSSVDKNDESVVQSRAPRSRKKPSTPSASARPSAGGGRGARKRIAKLNPVEQVLVASTAAAASSLGSSNEPPIGMKHPKLMRPEVDPLLDTFSDDDDEDDEEMTRVAMIVEASQTDQQAKWESRGKKGKVEEKRSYKSVADLSESGSSSDSD